MKILITGATGFVGRKLCEKLILKGYEVIAISRNIEKAKLLLRLPVKFYEGDLSKEVIDIEDKIDVVVNLLGENIGKKKWSNKQKEIILNSRKEATKNLALSLKGQNGISFIQASAIGYYKDSNGDELLNESSEYSNDFLSIVCQKWEKESHVFQNNFKNFCILRIGVVLGYDGALMHKILPIYRKGLGGKQGSGNQWMSWIHRDDLVSLIIHCIEKKVNGIYNAVSPNPVQNIIFSKVLGKYTQRPSMFTVPRLILKLIMGDQSYLALSSQKISSKIGDTGFVFKYPNIDSALKEICSYSKTLPINRFAFHNRQYQIQYFDKPLPEVFKFFSDAKNLEKITPQYLNFKINYQSTDFIEEGTIFKYQLKIHGLPIRWKTKIINWDQNNLFVDYQMKGPYQVWHHTHFFYALESGTIMTDEVLYRLPFGYIGELFALFFVKKDIKNIFNYRAQFMDKYFRKL